MIAVMEHRLANRARVVRALEEIVEGREDHIAESVYFEFELDGDDMPIPGAVGVPVCALGHLIAKLEPEAVDRIGRAKGEFDDVIFDFLCAHAYVSVPEEDVVLEDALGSFQYNQDRGFTWGYCLEKFKAELLAKELEH